MAANQLLVVTRVDHRQPVFLIKPFLTDHKHAMQQLLTNIHLGTHDAYKTTLLLHPFNGLFSRKTWVSRHQKSKPVWILLEQEMMGWHIQIICTSLQTDNHTSTSPLNFFTGRMPFLTPTQRCQSTEGRQYYTHKSMKTIILWSLSRSIGVSQWSKRKRKLLQTADVALSIH